MGTRRRTRRRRRRARPPEGTGRIGGAGVLHVVSALLVGMLGFARRDGGIDDLGLLVGTSAAVVAANGLASAWLDSDGPARRRDRFLAIVRGGLD